jgi:RNA polymerase sigma-70 factor (ECF subfamily)
VGSVGRDVASGTRRDAREYLWPVASAWPRRLDPDQLVTHVDRLFRAAWAMCGDRDDAEDLVQETYARVLARPRMLRGDDDLGYLLRVLRNLHVDRLRRSGRRPQEVPLDVEPESASLDLRRPEVALEVGELFAAIAALPDEAREAVVAVDVAGLSYREAAGALGVTEATLTTRLYRARGRLARTLTTDRASSRR